MRQFRRKARLTIFSERELLSSAGNLQGPGFGLQDYIVIEGLKLDFEVEKKLAPYSKVRVNITNMSEKHRRWIEDLDKNKARIVLEVKYEDDPAWSMLARADLSLSRSCFDLPDIVTKLDCDDGRVLLEQQASLNKPKGASHGDIFKEMKEKVRCVMNDPSDFANKLCGIGYNFTGQAKDMFEEVSNMADIDYTVIDDAVALVPKDGYYAVPGPVPLISEATGMIGIPEKLDDVLSSSGRQKKKNKGAPAKNPGLEITCLLNPRIVPGMKIQMVSKRLGIDGTFKTDQVNHSGDTHGDMWQTRIRVVSV